MTTFVRTFAAVTALALACAAAPGQVAPPPAASADKYALDADRLFFGGVTWDAPQNASEDANPGEYQAYNETLLHARKFGGDELLAAASRDVTFRDLVDPRTARDYQYKLLALQGRLVRVRRVAPTKPLADAGVANLYECWLFPLKAADPLCLLVSELPANVPVGPLLQPAVHVDFAGYYFKLTQYVSAQEKPDSPGQNVKRRAPLLMGRTFRVTAEPDSGRPDLWATGFPPSMMGLVGGVFAVGLALTWWFRRGDRAVKRTLEARRSLNPFDA